MEYTLYKNLLKLIDMNLSIEEMCEILNIDIITLKILIDDIRKNGDLKNENIPVSLTVLGIIISESCDVIKQC